MKVTFKRKGEAFVFRDNHRRVIVEFANAEAMAAEMAFMMERNPRKQSIQDLVVTEARKHERITASQLIAALNDEIPTSSACTAGRRLRKADAKRRNIKTVATLAQIEKRGKQGIVMDGIRKALRKGEIIRLAPGLYAPAVNGKP